MFTGIRLGMLGIFNLTYTERSMATYHLDTRLAQDIVDRTMKIIDSNVNVMDARGRIIGSGAQERIG